ncbi:MAG: hydroxymethylbilane synthase [Planctomycetaceae bacterium]|nr:hydroxymethylbilane synthase [Planctomycetaceae bacterium]
MSQQQRTLRIATRTSPLALWQANYMAEQLRSLPTGHSVEIVHIITTGDTNQTDALRQFGGTGVFTREVQKAVLDDRADLAVHSLKDLPTVSAEGLVLGCVPPRAPRCDALLVGSGSSAPSGLHDLPHNARIGTGSPRRQAQLLHYRPDLKLEEIRGNVDTRIRKLDEGQFDAIILAEAGLTRLGLADRISLHLHPPLFYPAVGQGALGIECRSDDEELLKLLAQITCPQTLAEVTAERALLRELRAGCHAPLAAWTSIIGDQLQLNSILLTSDGRLRLSHVEVGSKADAEFIGISAAQQLIAIGGDHLLNEPAPQDA